MTKDFEPRIAAFLCNWCAYAGADLAGVSRIQFPANIRVIRMMCLGRIDPVFIIQAFLNGLDGVLIGGCHHGDCHYFDGSFNGEFRVLMTKTLLEKTGFDPDRLLLKFISAAEGELFARTVTDFTELITELGPTPILDDSQEELRVRLRAALEATRGKRLRTLVGHEYRVTVQGNVYGEKFPVGRFNKLLDEAVEEELGRHLILDLLEEGPYTVPDLASTLKIPADKVFRYVVSLRADRLIDETGHKGHSPVFEAIKVEGG